MLKYKNTIKLKLEKKLQEDKPCQIINFNKKSRKKKKKRKIEQKNINSTEEIISIIYIYKN